MQYQMQPECSSGTPTPHLFSSRHVRYECAADALTVAGRSLKKLNTLRAVVLLMAGTDSISSILAFLSSATDPKRLRSSIFVFFRRPGFDRACFPRASASGRFDACG